MVRGSLLLALCLVCALQLACSQQQIPEGGYVAAQKLLQFITDNLILNNPNASEEMKQEAKSFDSSDKNQMMKILNFLNQNNARLSGQSIPLNRKVSQQSSVQTQGRQLQQQAPIMQQSYMQEQVVRPMIEETAPMQYQEQTTPVVVQVEEPMTYGQPAPQQQQRTVTRQQTKPVARRPRPRPVQQPQQRVVTTPVDQYSAIQQQQQQQGRRIQTAQTGGRLLSCQASQPIYDGDDILETYCRCSDGSYGFTCQEGFGNPCLNDQQFFPAHVSLGPSYFIHCSWSLPYLKKCPQNLIWDQDLTTCNWPTSIV